MHFNYVIITLCSIDSWRLRALEQISVCIVQYCYGIFTTCAYRYEQYESYYITHLQFLCNEGR